MPKNYCIMQIWAESGKSALPICNYSQILYQFLTFTQNLKRSRLQRFFCIVSDYSILFSAFTFFLNCFHLPFCNKFEVRVKTAYYIIRWNNPENLTKNAGKSIPATTFSNIQLSNSRVKLPFTTSPFYPKNL